MDNQLLERLAAKVDLLLDRLTSLETENEALKQAAADKDRELNRIQAEVNQLRADRATARDKLELVIGKLDEQLTGL